MSPDYFEPVMLGDLFERTTRPRKIISISEPPRQASVKRYSLRQWKNTTDNRHVFCNESNSTQLSIQNLRQTNNENKGINDKKLKLCMPRKTKSLTLEDSCRLPKDRELQKDRKIHSMKRMVANPTTIKDMRRNGDLMKEYNANHKDDLFGSTSEKVNCKTFEKGPISTKITDVKQGPRDILNELFPSDSETDISFHSARTPIGKYFEQSKTGSSSMLQDCVLDGDEQSVSCYSDQGKDNCDFQHDAFINRKINENRKKHRTRKNICTSVEERHTAIASNRATLGYPQRLLSRVETERLSLEMVKPIQKILQCRPDSDDSSFLDSECASEIDLSNASYSNKCIKRMQLESIKSPFGKCKTSTPKRI